MESVIREWLHRLATLYGVDANPAWPTLWMSNLAEFDVKLIDAAFVELENTFIPTSTVQFPLPAHLRQIIKATDGRGLSLRAEEAWQLYSRWRERFYHPDVGIAQGAPHLSAPVEHAARAAGGHYYLSNCSEDELQWAKKRFISDFELVHETGKAEHLLSDGEAKKILNGLARPPALPAPKQNQFANVPTVSTDEARARIFRKEPVVEISEEEWHARIANEKKKIAEWLESHPEYKPKAG